MEMYARPKFIYHGTNKSSYKLGLGKKSSAPVLFYLSLNFREDFNLVAAGNVGLFFQHQLRLRNWEIVALQEQKAKSVIIG